MPDRTGEPYWPARGQADRTGWHYSRVEIAATEHNQLFRGRNYNNFFFQSPK